MALTAYALALLSGAILAKCIPGSYLITAVAILIASVLLTTKLSGRTSRDVYQLDHAVLNIQPPKTMWLNMGYWKSTENFPEACEALAIKLGNHAGIREGERILDVGCGCGPSVVLWARKFKAREVVGVTSVSSHIQQAKITVDSVEDIPYDTKIDLQVGDAIEFTRKAANKGEKYDRVAALDCAYHFDSRREFLKQVEAVLEFTGAIGLTDLLLPDDGLSPISSFLMRIICFFANVPFHNLVKQFEYEAIFNEFGFTHIEVEDITSDVFPGLARYIDSLDAEPAMRAALDPAKLKQYKMFAKVLRWWSRDRLRFVLVKAMKGIKR